MTASRLRGRASPPSTDPLPPCGGTPLLNEYAVSVAGPPAGPARVRVARRGLVRSARGLATAAWLAFSGALALPAAVQAQEISLVSNIGQGHDTNLNINPPDFEQFGVEIGENRGAQRFTTGSNPAGYTLQSVVLNLHTNRGTGSVVQVAIHDNASSGNPGTLLAVLDNPADPIGNNTGTAGNRTFSAPNPLSLDADTRYWVMVSNTTTNNETNFDVSLTNSNNETSEHGFSIRNSRHQGTPGAWLESSTSQQRMEIRGTVVIPPGLEVTLHLSDNEPHEDLLAVAVTATASPASPVAFTVEISASPVAPATGDDFELSTNRTLSFAANATGSTGTVRIDPVADEDPEPNDVVTVSGVVSNPAIPNPDDVRLTILNDDADLPQDIAIDAPAAVDEGAGTANVTVTLTTRQNTAPVIDAQLFYRQRPGTATRGDDYTRPQGLGNRIAIVPVSEFSANADGTAWVARHSFEIGIVDDGEAERDETIVFEIYIISDNRGTEQTIVIRDDDRPPAVSIAAANPTVLEERPAVFTLSRTGATGSALTVTVALTEQADRDVLPDGAATERTVTFARGSSTAALTVELKDDSLAEPDGDLTAAVQAGDGYTVGDPSTVTVTVEDVDGVPVIEDIDVVSTPRLRWRNSREEDTYGEGENIRIGVRFDQTVRVEGYPVLALEVGDPCISVCEARYESGSGTDTLVFAYLVLDTEIDRNGVAIPADPIEVVYGDSIRSDSDHQARLSYRREGTKSGHRVDGTRQAAQHLSVEDAEAREADGEMAFTVRLEPRGLGIVTVDYATRDGSGSKAAVAGEDYTETRGTLRFNPLETERTVTVPIIDDDEEDDGETFTLRLSNPQGARLRDGDRAARGTIRNSEPKALSASFPASAFASASHGGADDRPQAVVAFSEAVAQFAADTPSVSVTGGAVASVQAHAEDGLENAWVFFLAPDGAGDVTFALAADAACAAGGICTAGGRTLTEVPAASTIPGPGETDEPEGPPLTAEFEDMPERHDGESAFTFRIAFSERVGWMNGRRLREDVVAVSGGRATAAGRVDRRRDLWEVTVEPDSEADVTVTVEAGAACRTPAAVCTSDGRALSETISATVAGPDGTPANAPAQGRPEIAGEARVGGTLTASTSGITDADGLDNATFAHQWLRGDADIPGATGRTYTAAEADEGGRLKVRVAFEDDAGHAESVTSAATGPVEAAPRANAQAQGRPEIAGEARVGGTLSASTSGISDADGLDNAAFAYQWLRDGADIPGATGAAYTAADADEGERLKVRVAFEDDAGNDESRTSRSTSRVAARPLPKASVADARVREAAGATLDFAVTLSAPPAGPVTVDYRTLDASAKAGEDYEARAGTLSFAAGETERTLRVTVLDDDVDEGDEKMVLVLDPGPGVGRGDRLASGTIENSDPLPQAWLVRFGRTASDHAVEAIETRFGDPGGASHATFGGRRLWGGGGLFDAPARGMPGDPFACGPFGGGLFGTAPDGGTGPDGSGRTFGANAGTGSGTNAETDCGTSGGTNAGVNGAMGAGVHGGMNAGSNRGMNAGMNSGMDGGMDGARRGPSTGGGHRPRLRDLLLGSAFRLSAGGGDDTGAPRRLTAWGGASATRFDGVADGVAVDGETATFLVGADASWNRWLAGITVAHSVGAGGFRSGPGGGAGELDSTLTAVHPYARWQANDRLSAWGVLGYGAGDLTLATNGAAWETDTSMRMAAGGLRGVLLRGAGGLELAAKTDLRVTRIASDGVDDNAAGLLAAAAGGTSRVRLLVEGSRAFRFGATRMLTPTLELGVRRDGGDAETGAGIDLGGSLRYADAALGLTAEASGRYLVAHGDDAYREWGASASVRIDPGTPGRGLTLAVTPSWGAAATGGAGRLWSVRDARGLAGHGFDAAMRLRAEVGYGLAAFRGNGAVTPFAGLSMAGSMGRDWRLGAQWTRGAALGMSLQATRRESPAAPPAHGIAFRLTWTPGARDPSPAAAAYAAGAAGPLGGPDPGAHRSGDGTRAGHATAKVPPAGAPPPDPSPAWALTPTDAGDAGPVAMGVVGGSGP